MPYIPNTTGAYTPAITIPPEASRLQHPEVLRAFQNYVARQGASYDVRATASFETDVIDALLALNNGLGVINSTATITISNASASVATGIVIPAGVRVMSAVAKISTVVTATTAVKVGLGISSDPDKYNLTSALTVATYGGFLASPVITTAAETLLLYACDTSGAAAGTINSGVVTVQVVYQTLPPLP
jgi:hypothetical protein